MLDPSHINLTRVIVEIVVGIPVLWVTIGFVYINLFRRVERRKRI